VGKRRNPDFGVQRLEQIKRLVVIAMFSDDELMDRLVLKGGNALDIVMKISTRASVDVDFSMPGDFPLGQQNAFRHRVERALKSVFNPEGYEVFDLKMEERPEEITADIAEFWGGYRVEFKLIGKNDYQSLKEKPEELRRNAFMLGQGSRFMIDISRFEYTEGKIGELLDGHQVFIYSPEMMVCEKLRAICQQMPEYGPVVKRTRPGGARARDFVDIHILVSERHIDLTAPKNQQLITEIFGAKRVPLSLLGEIRRYREFHRGNFAAVKATTKAGVELKEFDFYFDHVLHTVEDLKSLWDV
jgi:hypothetical protein